MADSSSNDGGGIGVMPRLMTNKVETCLWLTRLLTVLFGILFILPFVGGNPQGSILNLCIIIIEVGWQIVKFVPCV